MSFKDHFSTNSDNYSLYRPSYPKALFENISSLCQHHRTVWDVGTGSGQAAIQWAKHFDSVIATDASAAQIANATPHDKIRYEVWPAEKTEIPDSSIDLITIAQALHWFDFDKFYAEAKRVLTPGGIIAAWTYARPECETAAINTILDDFYFNIVGPYWPKERNWVDDHYKSIPFPFESVETPNYTLEFNWSLDQLIGYLDTWSASKAYIKKHGENPTDRLRESLSSYYSNQDAIKIYWPIHVIAGYVIASG